MTKIEFLKANLIHPLTRESCKELKDDELVFENGDTSKAFNYIPILIDQTNSIFKISDILKQAPTSQDLGYRNNSLKNTIRKKILPSLSKDFGFKERYENLSDQYKSKRILIIGAGDKVSFYNTVFKHSLVVTSDVHLLFSPDLVFDAHQIPFKDSSFDLIIASQVLEHTFKPWVVAKELQRVVKLEGRLLIEIPFSFPYHSPPYDFYRFTYTGLRSLFPNCSIDKFEANEGSASAIATFCSQFLIDLFSNRYLRMLMLFVSRLLFGWMKYLDLMKPRNSYLSLFSPMGFSILFLRDNIERTNIELLDEYYKLKS